MPKSPVSPGARKAPDSPSAQVEEPSVAGTTGAPDPAPVAASGGEQRSYRALQALYGPDGLVPAGGIFVASPSSGMARSLFSVEVEAEAAPDGVAAALAAADDE